MPYVIGIVASGVVAVFARYVGFDRDRAFYPTVVIVVALYYVLFAVMSGSIPTVVLESLVMLVFAMKHSKTSNGSIPEVCLQYPSK